MARQASPGLIVSSGGDPSLVSRRFIIRAPTAEWTSRISVNTVYRSNEMGASENYLRN